MTSPRPRTLWIGAAHEASDHGDDVRGFLRLLADAGEEPALTAVTTGAARAALGPGDESLLRHATRRDADEAAIAVHAYAPTTALATAVAPVNVLRARCTDDEVPPPWLPSLLHFDELWVPDEATRTRFAAAGVPTDRLRIVPGPNADRDDETTLATLHEAIDAALTRFDGRDPRTVTIRGDAGGIASLAVVNDGLARGLAGDEERTVRRVRPGERLRGTAGVTVNHSWPPDFSSATDGPTVLYLPWEFGIPPREWVDEIRTRVDQVWVLSNYIRAGYVAAGIPDGAIATVPAGVDTGEFTPDGPIRELPGDDAGCTFLFVGGSTWRKGIDRLLAAWRDAFEPGDDVRLVVKDFGTQSWYRGQTSGAMIAQAVADPAVAPIVYLPDEIPARELPALYRAADVGVFPYRGEGFCMPALEAMACGLPVIHTGIGPTSEFVPGDAGWAVAATRVTLGPEAVGGLELAGEGYIHECDHWALVGALRAAAADADDRRDRATRARRAAEAMSWEQTGAAAGRALDRLTELTARASLIRDAPRECVAGAARQVLLPIGAGPDADDWRTALAAWLRTIRASDDVTLVLADEDDDADALVADLQDLIAACGVPEDELADLALCEPGTRALALVAGVDGVLCTTPARLDPILAWRAPRVLIAGELDDARA